MATAHLSHARLSLAIEQPRQSVAAYAHSLKRGGAVVYCNSINRLQPTAGGIRLQAFAPRFEVGGDGVVPVVAQHQPELRLHSQPLGLGRAAAPLSCCSRSLLRIEY